MSIAKAVISGTVFRIPEKRFTQNNVAISSMVINVGERDEILVRVVSKRNYLDELVSSLSKGDKVLVEGRLQTEMIKSDDGTEKKIFEIDANTIERWGVSTSVPVSEGSVGSSEEIVKFESDDFSNELIGEDEIPF